MMNGKSLDLNFAQILLIVKEVNQINEITKQILLNSKKKERKEQNSFSLIA